MADRLKKIASGCLPLSALLSLAIGPSAAAADAHYAQHARLAKIDAARKAANAKTPPIDAPAPSTNDSAPIAPDHASQRVFNAFFAPASSKPTPTNDSGGSDLSLPDRTIAFSSHDAPSVLIFADGLCRPSVLHRPSFLANAPPIL